MHKNIFTRTVHELMKPFSLGLMLAFIVPNYILFMTYEYELQQTTQIQPHLIENSKGWSPVDERNYVPNLNTDVEINRKHCQNSECKFLFVYSNSEEEIRTNVNFINTFAYLANELNRTLVLTNVGRSRIDSCKKFPFEFYYNVRYLREIFPNLSFISQEDFRIWTKERIKKPDYHHLHLLSSPSIGNDNSVVVDDEPVVDDIQLGNTNCLENFEMKSDNNSTLRQKILIKSDLLSKSHYRKIISKILITKLNNSTSDILLIKNDIQKEIFPKNILSQTTLKNPYSEQINLEAWKINVDLDPSIAIYWSMIDVKDVNVLSGCVEKLVKTLKELRKKFNLNNVYLATDYSTLSSTLSSSSSSSRRSRFHRRAIDLLNSTMKINTWHSLGAFSEIRQDEKNLEEFNNGKGIVNILDKLVCTNSDYFITAPEGCYSKPTNNFIRDITNTRESLYYNYDDNQKIQNIISRW